MMGMGRHDIATRSGEGHRPMAWGIGLDEGGGRETCTPSSDGEIQSQFYSTMEARKAVASETEGWRLLNSSRSILGVEGRVVLLAWCHCSGMEAYAARCVAHDRARVEVKAGPMFGTGGCRGERCGGEGDCSVPEAAPLAS
ncbi:hypothetical protein CPLU01_00660 [Colletotrichum plurivorum]|uniref:Uncharacterized protein n=1 Tax=Colletotrichum plurivorum TaxID=2175906 RepID=A0A8H6NRA4_9PEZI|nr:hypothetical protein CPLU01_00660 [Colletotrichum plurivorum]